MISVMKFHSAASVEEFVATDVEYSNLRMDYAMLVKLLEHMDYQILNILKQEKIL